MAQTHITARFPAESPVGWHGCYGRMAGIVKGWVGCHALDVEYVGPRGRERHTVAVSSVIR